MKKKKLTMIGAGILGCAFLLAVIFTFVGTHSSQADSVVLNDDAMANLIGGADLRRGNLWRDEFSLPSGSPFTCIWQGCGSNVEYWSWVVYQCWDCNSSVYTAAKNEVQANTQKSYCTVLPGGICKFTTEGIGANLDNCRISRSCS